MISTDMNVRLEIFVISTEKQNSELCTLITNKIHHVGGKQVLHSTWKFTGACFRKHTELTCNLTDKKKLQYLIS